MNFLFAISSIAAIFVGIGLAIHILELFWPIHEKNPGLYPDDADPTWHDIIVLSLLFIMFIIFSIIFYTEIN